MVAPNRMESGDKNLQLGLWFQSLTVFSSQMQHPEELVLLCLLCMCLVQGRMHHTDVQICRVAVSLPLFLGFTPLLPKYRDQLQMSKFSSSPFFYPHISAWVLKIGVENIFLIFFPWRGVIKLRFCIIYNFVSNLITQRKWVTDKIRWQVAHTKYYISTF